MLKQTDQQIKEFDMYPSGGSIYTEFLDLINNLLVLDPSKRLTATEALNHPFFIPYQNIINNTRVKYPPVFIKQENPEGHMIKIIKCKERGWATRTAFVIYNVREGLSWYSHRIIFQSIDLFDRYLNYLDNQNGGNNGGNINNGGKHRGNYMSKYDTELRYVVCLYVCIKYFSNIQIPISFEELAAEEYKTVKALMKGEEFEKELIECLRYKIYRETVYEAADRIPEILEEYQIRDMLLAYGSSESINNISLVNLYYKVRGIKLKEIGGKVVGNKGLIVEKVDGNLLDKKRKPELPRLKQVLV